MVLSGEKRGKDSSVVRFLRIDLMVKGSEVRVYP